MDSTVKRLLENRRKPNDVSDKVMDISAEIHQAIQAGVKKVMTSPSFGFPEDEVGDYSQVDISFHDGYLMVEVRAEVGYDGLMELCDELNPTVSYYDDEAYFEPVMGGIIAAYLRISELEKIEEAVEDKNEITMEFASDTDAHEWASENGYEITKTIDGKFDKACICYMTKKSVNEASDLDSELVGLLTKLRTEATEALYKYEQLSDIGECKAILQYLVRDSKDALDYLTKM